MSLLGGKEQARPKICLTLEAEQAAAVLDWESDFSFEGSDKNVSNQGGGVENATHVGRQTQQAVKKIPLSKS